MLYLAVLTTTLTDFQILSFHDYLHLLLAIMLWNYLQICICDNAINHNNVYMIKREEKKRIRKSVLH